jgi:hypothetical protein
MLSQANFISLNFTKELTRAGIEYACRSQIYTLDDEGGSWYDRLQKVVADISVELAFRRYLITHKVPHKIIQTTPFSEPEHYEVSFGGRRCIVVSSLITKRDMIRRLRKNPKYLLKASSIVPYKLANLDHLADTDLFLFAFTYALKTNTMEELSNALNANQPIFLIHKFPDFWNHPGAWDPIGKLTLEVESKEAISINLGGLGASRERLSENILLHPGVKLRVKNKYFSLFYLCTEQLPEGKVIVHSPTINRDHIVQMKDWGNIWIYGMEITLVGYITCGQFRRQSSHLPAGSQSLLIPRTDYDNLALPIASLRPLDELFSSVTKWAKTEFLGN